MEGKEESQHHHRIRMKRKERKVGQNYSFKRKETLEDALHLIEEKKEKKNSAGGGEAAKLNETSEKKDFLDIGEGKK